MFVAEVFTSKYVSVEKTSEGFCAIVDDEVDDLFEAVFFMAGDINETNPEERIGYGSDA